VIIDCQTCPVRDLHCDECIVPAMLAPLDGTMSLDRAERAAVSRFVSAGLVSAQQAGGLEARREPWSTHAEAVG
jgi:hypothetical protein